MLEYDGSNVLQAQYAHGPGIDEPIAVTKGVNTYYYHQDGLGSVTDLTDGTGNLVKSYAYDAYGNILESPGAIDQPYTYTGREFDAETGLYYYRARYYDAGMGRFLQKDPIQFLGVETNFYEYAQDNPTNYRDWTGQKPRKPRPGGPAPNQPSGRDGDVQLPSNPGKAHDPKTGEVYDLKNPPPQPAGKGGTVQPPPPQKIPQTPTPSCQKAYEKCLEFCVGRCPRPLKIPCVAGCLLLRAACSNHDTE